MLLFNNLADLVDLIVVELADLGIRADSGGAQNVVGLRPPDSIDVGQPDLDSLVWRKIYASDTCHSNLQLTLPLLVFGIHTDNAHDTLAVHDLALVTNFLNRCSYFHNLFVSVNDPASGQIVG